MLNLYGDEKRVFAPGHGADIASQRADDLDNMALEYTTQGCHALDLASGAGGQAIRMAKRGAIVTAIDIADMRGQISIASKREGTEPTVKFIQADMRKSDSFEFPHLFRVVVCQRAIHYLEFQEAVLTLQSLRKYISNEGKVFLSASGINSELGDGYGGCGIPLEKRYAMLSTEMAEKHGIQGNVCLYAEEDIQTLATHSGYTLERSFLSGFGNVKAILRVASMSL